jgi:ClpP class serine protease
VGSTTVVTIRGPLESHGGAGWDSYDEIRTRIEDALASPSACVVLQISSPGGEAAGCFELARWIRGAAAMTGKPILAFVEDRACSAAYAIACGASKVYLSDSAIVGSIGVLSTRLDASAAAEARGIRVAFIASGARKADGHPERPLSEDEYNAQQTLVNSLASVFFEVVREARGIDAAALQAAVFHGDAAIAAGLADERRPLDQLLASLSGGLPMGAMDEARAALRKAMDGDDEKEAEAAKRALAAMDAEDDGDGEDAEHEEPDGDEPPKKKDAPPADDSTASALQVAANALSAVHTLRAELAARDARTERARLIEARPDLTADFVAVLEKLPVATVKELLAKTPRLSGHVSAEDALAAGKAKPTRGEQAGGGSRLSAEEKLALDKRMGLTDQTLTVKHTEHRLTLGETVSKIRGEANGNG